MLGQNHNVIIPIQNNRITLRVWVGQKNSLSSSISFGHIALKTYRGGLNNQGIYVSVWPGKCAQWNKDKKHLCQCSTSHNHTANQDDLIMNAPSRDINFDGLDVDAILKLYEDMKQKHWDYSLVASLLPTKDTSQQTCAAYVIQLLQAGGIEKYLPTDLPHAKTVGMHTVIGIFIGVILGVAVGTLIASFGAAAVAPGPSILPIVAAGALIIALLTGVTLGGMVSAVVGGGMIGATIGAVLGGVSVIVMTIIGAKKVTFTPHDVLILMLQALDIQAAQKIFPGTYKLLCHSGKNYLTAFDKASDSIHTVNLLNEQKIQVILPSSVLSLQTFEKNDQLFVLIQTKNVLSIYACSFKNNYCDLRDTAPMQAHFQRRWLDNVIKISACGRYIALFKKTLTSTTVVCIYLGENLDTWQECEATALPVFTWRIINAAAIHVDSKLPMRVISIAISGYTVTVPTVFQFSHLPEIGFSPDIKYLISPSISWHCCINNVAFLERDEKLYIITANDGGNICFWLPDVTANQINYLGNFHVSLTEIIYEVIISEDQTCMLVCTNYGHYFYKNLLFDAKGVLLPQKAWLDNTAHPAGYYDTKQGALAKIAKGYRITVLQSGKLSSYRVNNNAIENIVLNAEAVLAT